MSRVSRLICGLEQLFRPPTSHAVGRSHARTNGQLPTAATTRGGPLPNTSRHPLCGREGLYPQANCFRCAISTRDWWSGVLAARRPGLPQRGVVATFSTTFPRSGGPTLVGSTDTTTAGSGVAGSQSERGEFNVVDETPPLRRSTRTAGSTFCVRRDLQTTGEIAG